MCILVIQHQNLKIYDLTHSQEHDRIQSMLMVYRELMPDYGYYEPRMIHGIQQTYDVRPNLHRFYWYSEVDDEPAGLIQFEYVPGQDVGLVMDMAVLPPYRQMDFGTGYRFNYLQVREAANFLKDHALRLGRPKPYGLGNEIAHDAIFNLTVNVYHNIPIPTHYKEPPYVEYDKHLLDQSILEETQFRPMHLGLFPLEFENETRNLHQASVYKNVIHAFLIDHYGLATDHWAYQESIREVEIIIGETEEIS